MSVYYCGIDSCSIKETFEFEFKYYVGLHIIQLKLYSHGLNVSTKRLETLFWTSHLWLVLVALTSRSLLGLVTPKSRSRLRLETLTSRFRHHTPHLQPCALASLCHTLARVKFWGAITPKSRNNSLQKKVDLGGSKLTCPTFWIVDHFYIVSQKNPPLRFSEIFPKRMGIFQSIFTHLLHVPFYTTLQIFI